jgi:Fe-S-cluster-containing hydrogenase component 2
MADPGSSSSGHAGDRSGQARTGIEIPRSVTTKAIRCRPPAACVWWKWKKCPSCRWVHAASRRRHGGPHRFPQVTKARKSTLEFLLTNHPLDCPVCDKGGECELQDMVSATAMGESRFTEHKLHVDEQQWSPVVFYDKPRCILCYRCVRACDEGMGVKALGVGNRGGVRDRAESFRSSGMR